MSKIEDGNIKAAIRIISSDDCPADSNAQTLQALRKLHPPASLDRQHFPDPIKLSAVQFTDYDVTAAIRAFPAGSAGGPDGIRPQHLRDLTSNKVNGQVLVTTLTGLINILMNGKCPPSVTSVFFGGRLIALQKKAGGIRPISIGYTWRRLAAKCVNNYAISLLGDSVAPIQLGIGSSGGCEAAVHATRRFLANMPDDFVAVKLDFTNAFNSIHRDAVLTAIADKLPDIYQFCHLAYHQTSILQYGSEIVESAEGMQQGDPLGPLLFCLGIQALLSSLTSNLAFGYLDDVTIGGPLATVASDVAIIKSRGVSLGLHLNPGKCEVISNSGAALHPQFTGFHQLLPDSATLLGSPLSRASAMDDAITTSYEELSRAVSRLQLVSSHDALILLKNCLGGPKLQHVMRTSPCCDHPKLIEFDELLRTAVNKMCNVSLSEDQWTQASLPVRTGGLGVRSVAKLASSAFLASAAGTLSLQTLILQKTQASEIDTSQSLAHWKGLSKKEQGLAQPQDRSQRAWDAAVIDHSFTSLMEAQIEPYHRARLLAAGAAHSGAWLSAMPISACGLRLSDEAVRVAVGLRLGTELGQVHGCQCGATVDTRGTHAFSCGHNPGRAQRHHYINDLIWRSLTRAGIPSVKEPHGLTRSDGKRPDGLTSIPWREGRSATWDVTVTNTVATSYVAMSSAQAASAAEAAAQRKEDKYSQIAQVHLFYPLAFETMGPINSAGQEFLSDLGHRISLVTDDPRETSFLFQRISIALQRFNAVVFSNSFSHINDNTASLPKHTKRD
jgi:hypothetical protein